MTRLVHLSDLHFGTEDAAVLLALENRIQMLAPDLVAVSGDLTQRAKTREFQAAQRFLDALPAETLVVPGNHDIPLYNPMARALWPFRGYKRQFGKTSGNCFHCEPMQVIGINTARPERHASGRISARQQRLVSGFAAEACADDIVIVVLHHPLIVADPKDEVATIEHGQRALRQWQRDGVDLILSGHVHQPFLLSASTHSNASPWMLNAGTAISRRTRHGFRNSFNVIDASGHSPPIGTGDTPLRMLTIERWDYVNDVADFVSQGPEQLKLQARPV